MTCNILMAVAVVIALAALVVGVMLLKKDTKP